MFVNELAEPQLLVIYPGRFQPFHKGHYAVYEFLTGKFGRNNVYIATSNKTDNLKSPFTFSEKAYFMQLTGVPADRIVQATQPYQIQNVLQSGQITVSDPANTVVVFAVSEKDMAEDPRFSFAAKKDGSPAYFQKLTDLKQTESMNQHGYIMTVPTFDFTVLDQPMRSGTELRKMYADAGESQRQQIIKDLFGRYTAEAEKIMTKIVPAQAVAPAPLGNKAKLQKVAKPEPVDEAVSHFVPGRQDTKDGYYKLLAYRYKKNPGLLSAKEKQELHDFIQSRQVKEEAAGVGVVKGGKDPRYSMSLTKDVRPGQINKSLRAFNLAETGEPTETDRAWARIQQLNSLLDEIKSRLHREKLTPEQIVDLKKRRAEIEELRKEIALGRK
jgi:cytidyltransferase-like protein